MPPPPPPPRAKLAAGVTVRPLLKGRPQGVVVVRVVGAAGLEGVGVEAAGAGWHAPPARI